MLSDRAATTDNIFEITARCLPHLLINQFMPQTVNRPQSRHHKGGFELFPEGGIDIFHIESLHGALGDNVFLAVAKEEIN